MVGGPAIIFHRYAEVNKTFVRDNPEKPVQKIVGYDANSLYLWALTQPMPVGLYTTWTLSEGKLKPKKSWREADEWLAWEGHKRNVALRTRLNDTEKRPSDEKKVRVDGYDPVNRTVYEFQGCYWHGCPTCFDTSDTNPTNGKTYEELYKETCLRVKCLESLPNVIPPVVQCWECQWLKEKKASEIDSFLNQHFPGRGEKAVTPSQLMQRVKEGTFFGAVEVDIDTRSRLKKKFKEMTPIFKNREISLDNIGEHM